MFLTRKFRFQELEVQFLDDIVSERFRWRVDLEDPYAFPPDKEALAPPSLDEPVSVRSPDSQAPRRVKISYIVEKLRYMESSLVPKNRIRSMLHAFPGVSNGLEPGDLNTDGALIGTHRIHGARAAQPPL